MSYVAALSQMPAGLTLWLLSSLMKWHASHLRLNMGAESQGITDVY